VGGTIGNFTSETSFLQQSLVLGVGAGKATVATRAGSVTGIPLLAILYPSSASGSAFNGSIPFSTISPGVGFFDFPLTNLGVAYVNEITEGVPFDVTLYGATRTYMPTKLLPLGGCWINNTFSYFACCMRYD